MSCTLIKPPLILCVWKPTESRTDAHEASWISRRLPSQICERADCSRGFAAENRLHGTAKDSLVDFNDTEMGAGRILINDLSVDSPELSGNDRTGVDVEFSQHNECWCQDSGPNALLMSWCLKELVTVYLVNTHLRLDVSICLSICFYSYLIWPAYLTEPKRFFKGRTSLSPYRFLMLLSSKRQCCFDLMWGGGSAHLGPGDCSRSSQRTRRGPQTSLLFSAFIAVYWLAENLHQSFWLFRDVNGRSWRCHPQDLPLRNHFSFSDPRSLLNCEKRARSRCSLRYVTIRQSPFFFMGLWVIMKMENEHTLIFKCQNLYRECVTFYQVLTLKPCFLVFFLKTLHLH